MILLLRLSLARLGEKPFVEVGRDAEAVLDQGIEDRTDCGDQAVLFGSEQDPEDADDRQAEALRKPARSPLVEDQAVGAELEGQADRFALARIEGGTQDRSGDGLGELLLSSRMKPGRDTPTSRTTAGGTRTSPKSFSSRGR